MSKWIVQMRVKESEDTVVKKGLNLASFLPFLSLKIDRFDGWRAIKRAIHDVQGLKIQRAM
jgi:hypothetical protein